MVRELCQSIVTGSLTQKSAKRQCKININLICPLTYLKLILPFILILGGIQFLKDYFTNDQKENINDIEQLISQGEEVTAFLNNEYTEHILKIAKIPLKTYEIGYTFKVDGKAYTGSKWSITLPTEPVIKIKYLPTNPKINSESPEKELANLKKISESKFSLIVGLLLVLAGLGKGFSVYESFRT